jgi:hypothetical protein
MSDIVERLRRDATCTSHHEAADEIERLRADNANILATVTGGWDQARKRQEQVRNLEAERDRAVEARTEAIKIMSEMSRQAGSWQGIAEGKSIVIRQLEAERDRLREAQEPTTMWRHIKRGSMYREICRAEVQAATGPICEGDTVVIYGDALGHVWARKDSEFEDGRFERVAALKETGHE